MDRREGMKIREGRRNNGGKEEEGISGVKGE